MAAASRIPTSLTNTAVKTRRREGVVERALWSFRSRVGGGFKVETFPRHSDVGRRLYWLLYSLKAIYQSGLKTVERWKTASSGVMKMEQSKSHSAAKWCEFSTSCSPSALLSPHGRLPPFSRSFAYYSASLQTDGRRLGVCATDLLIPNHLEDGGGGSW